MVLDAEIQKLVQKLTTDSCSDWAEIDFKDPPQVQACLGTAALLIKEGLRVQLQVAITDGVQRFRYAIDDSAESADAKDDKTDGG